MKKLLSLFVIVPLVACSGSEVKNNLGLKKRAPDEFMVLSRPALTVPPRLDQLPEPKAEPTAPAPELRATQAKKALFGESTSSPVSGKPEQIFLNKAGSASANPDIRAQLEDDLRAEEAPAAEAAQEEKGFFGRLFSPIVLDEKPDPVVNPAAEKDRIRESQAQGEKVDGAETPTIQPKGESVIDRIF